MGKRSLLIALMLVAALVLTLVPVVLAGDPVTISTVLDKVFFVTDAAGNLVEVPAGTSATITIWGDGTATMTWSGGSGTFPSSLVGWGTETGTFAAPAGDAYLPAGVIVEGVKAVTSYSTIMAGMQEDQECWDHPHSDACRQYWAAKANYADVARPGAFGQTMVNGFPLSGVPIQQP